MGKGKKKVQLTVVNVTGNATDEERNAIFSDVMEIMERSKRRKYEELTGYAPLEGSFYDFVYDQWNNRYLAAHNLPLENENKKYEFLARDKEGKLVKLVL